jgi:hypothetical protein
MANLIFIPNSGENLPVLAKEIEKMHLEERAIYLGPYHLADLNGCQSNTATSTVYQDRLTFLESANVSE